MLIYEKDNKLNINFENSVEGEPDLQIGKDGDKTQILVDGQESGSGSNTPLICTETGSTLDKTMGEIQTASNNGTLIIIKSGIVTYFPIKVITVHYDSKGNSYAGGITCTDGGILRIYDVFESTEEEALAAYPTSESDHL